MTKPKHRSVISRVRATRGGYVSQQGGFLSSSGTECYCLSLLHQKLSFCLFILTQFVPEIQAILFPRPLAMFSQRNEIISHASRPNDVCPPHQRLGRRQKKLFFYYFFGFFWCVREWWHSGENPSFLADLQLDKWRATSNNGCRWDPGWTAGRPCQVCLTVWVTSSLKAIASVWNKEEKMDWIGTLESRLWTRRRVDEHTTQPCSLWHVDSSSFCSNNLQSRFLFFIMEKNINRAFCCQDLQYFLSID